MGQEEGVPDVSADISREAGYTLERVLVHQIQKGLVTLEI